VVSVRKNDREYRRSEWRISGRMWIENLSLVRHRFNPHFLAKPLRFEKKAEENRFKACSTK